MSKKVDIGEVAHGYWREEDARAVVAAWRASGERLSAFARRHGVRRQRIARWSRRLEAAAALHFHPVHVTGAIDATGPAAAIEIELPTGARIRLPRGFETDDLRRVVSVLGAAASC